MASMEGRTSVIVTKRPNTNVGDEEGQKLVERFRLYYLEERKAGRADQMQIFRDFRKTLEFEGIWFNPYRNMLLSYYKRWEQSLPFNIKKVPVRQKDTRRMPEKTQLLKEIAYHDLESGAKNLSQLLIEDAEKLIEQSHEEYAGIDQEGGVWSKTEWAKIQLARKKLALGIASEVMKGAQKHELIGIKKNKEGRENVGFLMDLIHRSAAGEITDSEMQVLEGAIA